MTKSFMGFVHPVYAVILSIFDGEKNIKEVLESVAALLRKDLVVISKIIEPLLENNGHNWPGP